MKKLFTFFAMMLLVLSLGAQTTEYLLKKEYQSEKKKMTEGIDAAKKAGTEAKKMAAKQMSVFDSLSKSISSNEKALKQNADSLQFTTARFNALLARVSKISTKTKYFLRLIVIITAIVFLFLASFIFFLRKRLRDQVNAVSEENQRMDGSMKQELDLIRQEQKKNAEALAQKLHENVSQFALKIELIEEKQQSLATRLDQLVDKVSKEQALLRSATDEKLQELSATINSEMASHLTLHDRIETEVKGLKSMHLKDIEEIRKNR